MLLNRCLTVEAGKPGSHQDKGWEIVTDAAIKALNNRRNPDGSIKPLVAILWGRKAQTLGPLLTNAYIIASPHPSPMSARYGFFGSKPFSRAYQALIARRREACGLVPPVSLTRYSSNYGFIPSEESGTAPTPVPMPAVTKPSTLPPEDINRAKQLGTCIRARFAQTLVGQDNLRESLITTLVAGGHILIESVPGLAKTTAAQTLATSVSGSFKRVQCTPDLMPSDLVGTQVFDFATQKFSTQIGPIHANFVLLDEINRSNAKTQSAMLEAMAEGATTIGGQCIALPKPFMSSLHRIQSRRKHVQPS